MSLYLGINQESLQIEEMFTSTEHNSLGRVTRFSRFIMCGTQMALAEMDEACYCQHRTSMMVNVIRSMVATSRNTVSRNIHTSQISLWERICGASKTSHC